MEWQEVKSDQPAAEAEEVAQVTREHTTFENGVARCERLASDVHPDKDERPNVRQIGCAVV